MARPIPEADLQAIEAAVALHFDGASAAQTHSPRQARGARYSTVCVRSSTRVVSG